MAMGRDNGGGAHGGETLAGQAIDARVRRLLQETRATEHGAEAAAEEALHANKGDYDAALQDLREYIGSCVDGRNDAYADAMMEQERLAREGYEDAYDYERDQADKVREGEEMREDEDRTRSEDMRLWRGL